MSFTDYLEDAILNHIFGGVSYTPPANLYVALSTTPINDDGSGITEPSGGGYERQAATFTVSGGVASNDAKITFPQATASWGTITHFAIYDAQTGGNMLAYGSVSVAKTIDTNDVAEFDVGQLQITLD